RKKTAIKRRERESYQEILSHRQQDKSALSCMCLHSQCLSATRASPVMGSSSDTPSASYFSCTMITKSVITKSGTLTPCTNRFTDFKAKGAEGVAGKSSGITSSLTNSSIAACCPKVSSKQISFPDRSPEKAN